MRVYAAWALAALTAASGAIPARASHPRDGLPDLALEAWRAANAYHVSGVAPAMPDAVRSWFERERPFLDRLRAAWPYYVWQTTELTRLDAVRVHDDLATVRVRIDSALGISAGDDAPYATYSGEELRFLFAWSDEGWVLRDVTSFGKP